MNKILVCYQIKTDSASFNYENFHQALASYPQSEMAMNNCYVIKSLSNERQVYEHLYQYIDKDDCLFCTKLDRYYTGFIKQKAVDLLTA